MMTFTDETTAAKTDNLTISASETAAEINYT